MLKEIKYCCDCPVGKIQEIRAPLVLLCLSIRLIQLPVKVVWKEQGQFHCLCCIYVWCVLPFTDSELFRGLVSYLEDTIFRSMMV